MIKTAANQIIAFRYLASVLTKWLSGLFHKSLKFIKRQLLFLSINGRYKTNVRHFILWNNLIEFPQQNDTKITFKTFFFCHYFRKYVLLFNYICSANVNIPKKKMYPYFLYFKIVKKNSFKSNKHFSYSRYLSEIINCLSG